MLSDRYCNSLTANPGLSIRYSTAAALLSPPRMTTWTQPTPPLRLLGLTSPPLVDLWPRTYSAIRSLLQRCTYLSTSSHSPFSSRASSARRISRQRPQGECMAALAQYAATLFLTLFATRKLYDYYCSMASLSHSTEQPERTWTPLEPRYQPSIEDVLSVKDSLMKKFRLPREIVDPIIDFAEYWPRCTTTKSGPTTSIRAESDQNNRFLVNTTNPPSLSSKSDSTAPLASSRVCAIRIRGTGTIPAY